MPLFNLHFGHVRWEGAPAPRQAAHEQLRQLIAIAQCVIKVKHSFYLHVKQDKLGTRGESGPPHQLEVMLDM